MCVSQDAYEYNQRWLDGQIGLLIHETPIVASDILHFPYQHGCLSVCKLFNLSEHIPKKSFHYFKGALQYILTETLGWCWRTCGYHRG